MGLNNRPVVTFPVALPNAKVRAPPLGLVGKIPVGKTPVGKTLVGKTPVGKTPAGKTPVGKTPVGKTPTGNALVRVEPVLDISVGKFIGVECTLDTLLCSGKVDVWFPFQSFVLVTWLCGQVEINPLDDSDVMRACVAVRSVLWISRSDVNP